MDLINWIPNIQKSISALPVTDIQDAVRSACRKFCKETWLRRYTQLVDVVEDVSEYSLEPPEDSEIEAIPDDGVKYKGDSFINLTCTSESELDATCPNWRHRKSLYPSRFYVSNVDKHLFLVPRPEEVGSLEVTCILRPSRNCLAVPDFLYDDYEIVIESGALEDLFNRRNRTYYDPNEAMRHRVLFREGYNEAKIKRFTGATNKPFKVKMGYFA